MPTKRNSSIIMPLLFRFCSSLMLVLLLSTCAAPPIGPEPGTVDIGSGIRINPSLKSFKTIRDHNVIKQAYDFSCGAAALATLLTYGLIDTVTEQEVLIAVLEALSKDAEAARKKEGLSLLDLKKVAEDRGHMALGFRLSPDFLTELKGPVIVYITPRGYEHFAVFRGVWGNRVYLADPSLGNIRMSNHKFLDMWLDEQGKGIIFVVERKDSDLSADYPLKIKVEGISQPELLGVRQLLNVGDPYVRFPELLR